MNENDVDFIEQASALLPTPDILPEFHFENPEFVDWVLDEMGAYREAIDEYLMTTANSFPERISPVDYMKGKCLMGIHKTTHQGLSSTLTIYEEFARWGGLANDPREVGAQFWTSVKAFWNRSTQEVKDKLDREVQLFREWLDAIDDQETRY